MEYHYQVGCALFELARCLTAFSLFYIPGTVIGAFVVDFLGPKYTMVSYLQAVLTSLY